MKTELEIVDPVIEGGNIIKVHSMRLQNQPLHQVCEPISQLIFGLLESDSGNSGAKNSARETRNFWHGWDMVKLELSHAKKFRDRPRPVHEYSYDILVPTRQEVMSITNVKVKRLVQELVHLQSVIIGLDSARMQTWLDDSEAAEIEEMFEQCEEVFKVYFGTGDKNGEGFDTGVVAPRYAYGQLVPDLDRNAAYIREPATAPPPSPKPDAPDNPSIAPSPGQAQMRR